MAAFAAAVALAFGPTYLYFSRFAREDIYVACITLALLVAIFRYLARPSMELPAVIGGLLALSFATKETTFISVFVGGSFFLAALAHPRWRRSVLDPLTAVGAVPWVAALAAFAGTFTVMFTTFFTHPAGLWDGIHDGIAYWLGQQPVGRGGEPWYFYIVLLFAEEWPVLLLGAVGAAVAVRRPTLLRLFLIWAFVVSLAVYSWAGEKFSWLVLHPLLPLILLAGLGVQAIWSARRRRLGASASRPPWRGSPTSAWRRSGRTRSTAPTRGSSSSPRSPRSPSRACATRSSRCWRAPAARAAPRASSSTAPTARRSRGRGTSATCPSPIST